MFINLVSDAIITFQLSLDFKSTTLFFKFHLIPNLTGKKKEREKKLKRWLANQVRAL
jgi:hypothetical protein